MSDTKQYKKYNVEIIINKRLKHSYIHIKNTKEIIVKTPNASESFVEKFLEEKSHWIEKQLKKIENYTSLSEVELHSQEYIESRMLYYSELMQLPFTKLKFKKMKSQWGSCNSRGEIRLNSQLQRVEKNLMEYVLVHELAHLQHMNHSKSFHALVDKFLPNSTKQRDALKNIKLS